MKIQTKVKKFVKYLRTVLDADCCEHNNSSELTDTQVLEIFRTCMDCGDEVITPQQQMHAIIEFDSEERAFETLCELIFSKEDLESCATKEEDNFDFDLNI